MTYPELTNLTTNIAGDMFRYSNNVLGGYFGLGILLTLWVILFLNLMYSGRIRAATTSTMIIAVLGILFRFMSILNDVWMTTFIVLGIISLLMLFIVKEDI